MSERVSVTVPRIRVRLRVRVRVRVTPHKLGRRCVSVCEGGLIVVEWHAV